MDSILKDVSKCYAGNKTNVHTSGQVFGEDWSNIYGEC